MIYYIDGDIADDSAWQSYWRRFRSIPRSDKLSADEETREALFAFCVRYPKSLTGYRLKPATARDLWSFVWSFCKGGCNNQICERNEKGEITMVIQNTIHNMGAKLSSRQDGKSPERRAKKVAGKDAEG
jgi:hypothetical protein